MGCTHLDSWGLRERESIAVLEWLVHLRPTNYVHSKRRTVDLFVRLILTMVQTSSTVLHRYYIHDN